MFRLNGFESYYKFMCEKMIDISCLGSCVKNQTRAAVFACSNKLLSVGEWRRRVLLPPSHFLDSLLPQNRRTQFVYSAETEIDNADKRRKVSDGGEKTHFCKNPDKNLDLDMSANDKNNMASSYRLRHAKLSLSYWPIVMTSPVEFSTGEFGAKQV